MTFNIKVSSLDNNIFWEKQLTSDEYQQVKDYVKGKDTVSIIPATFKPVRTNNLKDFSKDFFLPTTINHAIKVQHVVGKIFAILASLVLDVATFPIRLLTVIPRVISNAKKEESQLHKYLITEGVDKKLLESDHVRVQLEWEKISRCFTAHWTTQDGVQHSSHSQEEHWKEEMVNFIEVPTYEGSGDFSSGMGMMAVILAEKDSNPLDLAEIIL